MSNMSQRLLRDESGQDIIEYALLAAFISVVAYALLDTIGQDVSGLYADVQPATAAAGAASS